MFIRRLGHKNEQLCSTGLNCPQILELADGDFAAVGADISEEVIPAIPPGLGIGQNERVVRIPRHVLVAVRADIPAA